MISERKHPKAFATVTMNQCDDDRCFISNLRTVDTVPIRKASLLRSLHTDRRFRGVTMVAGALSPFSEPGWPQYEMPMNRCANGGDLTQYPQQPGIAPNLQQKDMSLPIQKVSTTPSMCSMPVATSSTANDLSCNPLLKSLVTSTPASASSIGLIGSENTEVRNLMDQIDPTHSLNDLGDGCLDGILNGPNDDCAQQPSTSDVRVTLSVHLVFIVFIECFISQFELPHGSQATLRAKHANHWNRS
uniref:TORC_N domain-containing protein n=1 Tax=Syphacia muris TaxID=451379 RepID=A0A0N5ABX2_9BILA